MTTPPIASSTLRTVRRHVPRTRRLRPAAVTLLPAVLGLICLTATAATPNTPITLLGIGLLAVAASAVWPGRRRHHRHDPYVMVTAIRAAAADVCADVGASGAITDHIDTHLILTFLERDLNALLDSAPAPYPTGAWVVPLARLERLRTLADMAAAHAAGRGHLTELTAAADAVAADQEPLQ